ncbi:hypothetical protein EVAR_58103_1 [Eumeta japonica]|uniref:Uncharacterized protein n=1 Tax=Eumeta variegata TaxID=151549 RepID=A0A4C1YQA3_EUMVA|nr:hypothetical protein EVAR_58103_1 [Eumeta japonica]
MCSSSIPLLCIQSEHPVKGGAPAAVYCFPEYRLVAATANRITLHSFTDSYVRMYHDLVLRRGIWIGSGKCVGLGSSINYVTRWGAGGRSTKCDKEQVKSFVTSNPKYENEKGIWRQKKTLVKYWHVSRREDKEIGSRIQPFLASDTRLMPFLITVSCQRPGAVCSACLSSARPPLVSDAPLKTFRFASGARAAAESDQIFV